MEGQVAFDGMPEPLYPVTPTRLLTWLDCPRRYRMQYLDDPKPAVRPQRAHTSVGLAVHQALRDWWSLPERDRTADAGPGLVERSWIDVGFRDRSQSASWRGRCQDAVRDYLGGIDPSREPAGVERTVAMRTGGLRVWGRVDRLDDRDGELVVVDYKTSRRTPSGDDCRTSLALALYAAAIWKMFRRPCLRVELHHVPTGSVVGHGHSPESLGRKVEEARSIAQDTRRADRDHARCGSASDLFPARVGPLCRWCDFRAHCPEGQQAGPEQPDWAGLAAEESDRT